MVTSSLKYLVVLLFLLPIFSLAQEEISTEAAAGDLLYREDQFYVGVTYNLIGGVPDGVNLSGVSGGINFGFLRDMPINAQRNISIAVGGGLAFDRIGQTLFIGEDASENTIFRTLDNQIDYDYNRFSTATVELPFEFRWRTSTTTDYKFWRIYGGIRVGYTYWYQAIFRQPGNEVSQTDIPEFDRLRLGATLTFGYSTFNFYGYYGINPFFKDARTINTDEKVDFRVFKLGVIFYVL